MEIMLSKVTLVLDVGSWEESQEDDNSQIQKEKMMITFLFSFLHIFPQKRWFVTWFTMLKWLKYHVDVLLFFEILTAWLAFPPNFPNLVTLQKCIWTPYLQFIPYWAKIRGINNWVKYLHPILHRYLHLILGQDAESESPKSWQKAWSWSQNKTTTTPQPW